MPAGQDEEIAVIFREMRKATELSLEQLSVRLKTPVRTIEALEAGAILALPEWTETSRVVTAYTGLLGLDSRPVLRRLKAQLPQEALAAAPGTATPPAPPRPRPPAPPAEAAAPAATPGPAPAPKPSVAAAPEAAARAPAMPAAAPSSAAPAAAAPPPVAPPQAGQPAAPAPATGLPMPPGAQARVRPSVPPPAPSASEPREAVASVPPPRPTVRPEQAAPVREAPQPKVRPAKARAEREEGKPRRRGRISVTTVVSWGLLLVIFAAMGFGVRYVSQRPQLIWDTVDKLPEPAQRMTKMVWEFLRPQDDAPPTGKVPKADKEPTRKDK